MSTAKNLLRSSATRTFHALTVTVVAFFMMPFLVHALGERWYGVWVLIANLAGNYHLLDLGLAAGVTRFVSEHTASEDDEGVNVVINTAFCLYVMLAVLIVACTGIAASLTSRIPGVGPDLTVVRLVVVIVGLQFAAEFPFKAFAGIFASYVRHDLLIYSRLLSLVLSTSLTVYFVRRDHGLLTIVIVNFCCDQVSNAIYFMMARRLFPGLRIRARFVRKAVVRELFGYSSWALVVQLANQLRFKIDSLVVASILSATAVTYYAVGQRLVEHFVVLVNRATNMSMPVFTRYWVLNQREELVTKLLLLTRINAVLGLFGGGMILVLGRPFIERWMGPQFLVSYPVLVVLMVAMTAELIGCNVDNLFYAASRLRQLAFINLAEGILNLALSVILARRFGIVGVAIGTGAPLLLFRLLVMPRCAATFTALTPGKFYWNLVPTTLFTTLYLGSFSFCLQGWLDTPSYSGVAAAALCGVPLYAASIPFVAFRAEERRYLWALLRRRPVAPSGKAVVP